MTDKEIEKALEICPTEQTLDKCEKCPYFLESDCVDLMAKDALDYINRLKAQNEELRKANNAMGLAMNCFCNKEENDE